MFKLTGIGTLETGIFSGIEIEDAKMGFDRASVVTTLVAETSEFMTLGLGRMSVTPVTDEQMSARA